MRLARLNVASSDTRGITIPLVALLLGAILILVTYFINVGSLLVVRTKLQTIAEFAAAGGGRVIAEAVAARASENIANGIFPEPSEDELLHPEWFLTPADREELQNSEQLKNDVFNQARYYAHKNNVHKWNDILVNMHIDYPEARNKCDGEKNVDVGRQNTIEVMVEAAHNEPLFLERLAAIIHGQPNIELRASSFYSIPLCP